MREQAPVAKNIRFADIAKAHYGAGTRNLAVGRQTVRTIISCPWSTASVPEQALRLAVQRLVSPL